MSTITDAGNCANCGEPIERQQYPGFDIYCHPTHGRHTVCDWYEGMAPTARVATPQPCAACGAEAGEVCRPLCIGEAAALD